jgi:DNA-binding PadR family transcriptional regulator
MEELGWVEAEWGTSDKGKRAKFYSLTTSGRRALRRLWRPDAEDDIDLDARAAVGRRCAAITGPCGTA